MKRDGGGEARNPERNNADDGESVFSPFFSYTFTLIEESKQSIEARGHILLSARYGFTRKLHETIVRKAQDEKNIYMLKKIECL